MSTPIYGDPSKDLILRNAIDAIKLVTPNICHNATAQDLQEFMDVVLNILPTVNTYAVGQKAKGIRKKSKV